MSAELAQRAAPYTELDDGAFLTPGVTIANDLYPGDPTSAAMMAGPHIGRGAQIGANVTLLPYVRIGEGSLIGAGSVVTRDIPAGVVAYGNPAVPRRPVTSLPPIASRPEAMQGSARLISHSIIPGRTAS